MAAIADRGTEPTAGPFLPRFAPDAGPSLPFVHRRHPGDRDGAAMFLGAHRHPLAVVASPPSTGMTAPVRYEPALLARNTAMPAMSPSHPMRRSGAGRADFRRR